MVENKVLDFPLAVLFELREFLKDPDYRVSLKVTAFFLDTSRQSLWDCLSGRRPMSIKFAEKVAKFLVKVEKLGVCWATILASGDLENEEGRREAAKLFEDYDVFINTPIFGRIINDKTITYDSKTKLLTSLLLKEAERIKGRPELAAALRKKFIDFKRTIEDVKTQARDIRTKGKGKD